MLIENSGGGYKPSPLKFPSHLKAMRFPRRRALRSRGWEAQLQLGQPGRQFEGAHEVLGNTGNWLAQLYELCGQSEVRPAIYMVIDHLDDLLYEHKPERCDEILQQVDVRRLPVEVMLAFLVATLKAKGYLRQREEFYSRVEARLREVQPDQASALLGNLK